MKNKIIAIACLSLATIVTLSTAAFAGDAKPAPVGTAEIKVPTLVCDLCSKKITQAIQSVDGVTSVSIDQKNKTATVSFDPAKTNLEKIETAITKAGYAANDKKADPVAFSKLDECCQAK